jgi:transcriptional regulator with XRE-family HTH domain
MVDNCVPLIHACAMQPGYLRMARPDFRVVFEEMSVASKTRNSMGPRIRELRIERGMTLDGLATAAGISASHLSRLERGHTAPSFKVAAEIANHIGVKPSDLATIQREQSDVDTALIAALLGLGLEAGMAQHICDRISTSARAALVAALRDRGM